MRESVRRDQPAHFRPEESVVAAIAKDKHHFCHRELQQDRSKDEQDARALRKGLWLVDPKLHNRGGKKQERDDEVFGRLRLLTAEDKKSETADESGEDENFDGQGVLEIARQFVAGAPAPRFPGGKASSDESTAFKTVEHVDLYLRELGAGERCS